MSKEEDKDYGFPFVEVTKLQKSSPKPVPTPEVKEEKVEEVQETAAEVKPIPVQASQIKKESLHRRQRKSSMSVMISIVLLIVIILGSLAYFMYYLPESEKAEKIAAREAAIEEAPVVDSDFEEQETELVEELAADEMEDDLVEEILEEPEVVNQTNEPATQAPISSTVSDEPIMLEERGASPYYNLIVGSAPNARIAFRESKKWMDKGHQVWIIAPFGNTTNYRIAVARYGTLEEATAALPQAKIDFTDAAWILKY